MFIEAIDEVKVKVKESIVKWTQQRDESLQQLQQLAHRRNELEDLVKGLNGAIAAGNHILSLYSEPGMSFTTEQPTEPQVEVEPTTTTGEQQ
jgi:hypothetical protein